MNDSTSFAIAYPVNGYQSGTDGTFNPIDVCLYYLSGDGTSDWANIAVPLAISSAHVMSMYGCHSWVDGTHLQWAYDKSFGQQLSMQDLYARHGHPILPEHPVYSNAELTNILGYPQLSLLIDPSQGNPNRIPDGIWYQMLNGGNNNGWNLVVQDNPDLWIADWPPINPRDAASN